MTKATSSKPWWREPWPWILMAGPAAAIAGCAVTIALAVQNFADQPIVDGGSKHGLVIERSASAASAPDARTGESS
ncbi:MAG TPA: FixH family protein [Pusillimonas sp.]|uniref:FixH family protein n=1 Tax=Pusillimonas sp. TaxID=3040095 RepID=UPI002D0318B2|nr:FixH family protein [Pusillimonas sp.]HUH87342.1 FixH family protein [Pusillimonas sp.]